MYKKDYMRFEMKPGESLDDFFARFNKILSNLRSVNVTYTDAENARQLLGALDMSIWEMKVTSIRESTVMSTLTLDVLYSKLKTHELDVFARKILLRNQLLSPHNLAIQMVIILPLAMHCLLCLH
jgi:hypothetical protein